MRNIYLMSAALVLMTMSANAQSMKRINKEATAKTWVETATPQKAAKKIATRAGELKQTSAISTIATTRAMYGHQA